MYTPTPDYYQDYIAHHGIKGQKWGVQNGPPYPLNNKHNNYKSKHLEKWGNNENTNTLYISGRSGSGKSTMAEKYADKNTNIVHLDLYLEKQQHGQANKNRDKDLDKYLKYKNFDTSRLVDQSIDKKERWKAIDEFGDILLDFSKNQYKNHKKVIVEGVQLLDETIYPDKSILYGKPIIFMNTNYLTSYVRANKRDNANFKKVLKDVKNINERVSWERIMNKHKKDILKHMLYHI